MAYVKKDWHDLPLTDTPVTADDLDRIENGIEENDKRLNGTKSIQNTIYVNDIKCKNLFNSGIEQGAITGSAFEPNSTRIRTNNFIKVEPGKTYIVSFSSSSALNYDIHYFTTNSFPRSSETDWTNNAFTIPSGINYILITFKKSAGGDITPSEISNVQLELGSEATPYTPYKGFDNNEIGNSWEDISNEITINNNNINTDRTKLFINRNLRLIMLQVYYAASVSSTTITEPIEYSLNYKPRLVASDRIWFTMSPANGGANTARGSVQFNTSKTYINILCAQSSIANPYGTVIYIY